MYGTPASITSGYFVNTLRMYSGKNKAARKNTPPTAMDTVKANPAVPLIFL